MLFVLFWSQQAVSRFAAPTRCCSRWWWRWSSQSCSEPGPESGCNWTQHAESEPTRHCSQQQKQKVDWQTEVIKLLCWTCTNLDMCCSLKNPEHTKSWTVLWTTGSSCGKMMLQQQLNNHKDKITKDSRNSCKLVLHFWIAYELVQSSHEAYKPQRTTLKKSLHRPK